METECIMGSCRNATRIIRCRKCDEWLFCSDECKKAYGTTYCNVGYVRTETFDKCVTDRALLVARNKSRDGYLKWQFIYNWSIKILMILFVIGVIITANIAGEEHTISKIISILIDVALFTAAFTGVVLYSTIVPPNVTDIYYKLMSDEYIRSDTICAHTRLGYYDNEIIDDRFLKTLSTSKVIFSGIFIGYRPNGRGIVELDGCSEKKIYAGGTAITKEELLKEFD